MDEDLFKNQPTFKIVEELQRRMSAIEPFRHLRWARCDECAKRYKVRVTREHRLRDQRSACCDSRMHVLNWRPRG